MRKDVLVSIIIIVLVIGIILGFYIFPYLIELLGAEEGVFGPAGDASPPALPQ